jgi:NPCBM/NEW2 domain
LHLLLESTKAVLWCQGENDTYGIAASNNLVSGIYPGDQFILNNYQGVLNSLIGFSREAATGKTAGQAGFNDLNWFVAKTSATPIINLGTNINDNLEIVTINGADARTSAAIKLRQTVNSADRVFEGPNTDNYLGSGQRSSGANVHFTGNSLNDLASAWYSKISIATGTSSVPPAQLLSLTSVTGSSGTYKLTVNNSIAATHFFWQKNNDAVMRYPNTFTSALSNETTVDNFTFTGVIAGDVLHCYAFKNGRFHPVVPYKVLNSSASAVILDTDVSTLSFNSAGGSSSVNLITQNVEWEIYSKPSWVTDVFNEDNNSLQFSVLQNSIYRSGDVVLRDIQTNITKTITISQSGSTVTNTNLTSLPPLGNSGWHRLNTSIDNNTMQVGGVQYFNGFGVHANNSMFFNLNGQYSTISGKVGRDDEGDNIYGSGNVVFYIKGDGVVKWTSAVQGNTSSAQDFTNVNVSGVTTLELYYDISSDNDYFDHGDWINPILTSGGGGGCNTAPAAPTNVSASAYTVATAGQTSTLYATCAGGSTITWGAPINATGSPKTVTVNAATNYTVTCVTQGCPASNPVTLTITVGPCSGLVNNNQVLGTWTVTGHPLVAKTFHNQYWLTQRINSSPEQFLVRGIGMLTRNDVTLTGSNYSNNWGCFGWNEPTNGGNSYGYLATPNSSQFPTPAGYTLAYECAAGVSPCNATNGTPYYTYTGGARKAAKDTLDESSFVTIIPNPNTGDFSVKVDLDSDSPLDIAIINSNGVVYENISFDGKKGINYVPYKTQKVGSGRYLLRVKSKDKIESTVLVIE